MVRITVGVRILVLIGGLMLCSMGLLAAEPEEPATPEVQAVPETPGSGATVTDTLQGKDGLRIQTMCTHCNSSNIQVGGLSEELVPVLRDGYPLLGGLATSVVLSVLPPDMIIDSKVTKGPGEASAPATAAGGTIALTEPDPTEIPWFDLSLHGGSYGLFGGDVRLAGPIGESFSTMILAGTAEADPVDDDRDGANDVGAIDRQYAEGRLAWSWGDAHEVDFGVSWIREDSTDARGAFDILALIGSSDPATAPPIWTREDTSLDRMELRAGWIWRSSAGGKLDLKVLDTGRDQNVASQLSSDPPPWIGPEGADLFDRFRIREDQSWASIRYSHPIGAGFTLHSGLEARDQDVRAETLEILDLIFGGTPEPDVGTETLATRSAFVDVDWTLSSRWTLQGGLRHEDLEWGSEDALLRTDSKIIPRATIQFRPNREWTLRLIGGETFRAPQPILAQVCCGQSYQSSANANAETAQTFALETVFQPGREVRISTYLARSDFDEFMIRIVGWSQIYTQTYALMNVPEARAETAELAMQWDVNRKVGFDGSIGWLSFHNQGDNDVIVPVTPPSFDVPQMIVIPVDRIPYRASRTGSLAMNLSLSGGVVASVSGSYIGNMLIQQFAADPFSAQNILLAEMRETPGFWLSNLAVTVPIGKHFELLATMNNLSGRIQNDLGDPTTDYNWGPLSGRSWGLGLRMSLDR